MKNASILILLFLVACSTPLRRDQARAVINSNPPYATIFEYGNPWPAPADLTWKVSGDKVETRIITVKWVSGATASARIELTPGQMRSYTIQRPNAPGAEIDALWAIQQQQRKAASDAAVAESMGTVSEQLGRIIGGAAARR